MWEALAAINMDESSEKQNPISANAVLKTFGRSLPSLSISDCERESGVRHGASIWFEVISDVLSALGEQVCYWESRKSRLFEIL